MNGNGTNPLIVLGDITGNGNDTVLNVDDGNNVISTNKAFQGAYKSADGSGGITGTLTTASLVGKTVTIKNGIITSVA